ncbi:putative deoxyribonuclease RhsC [Candidatus Phycosocius bacilliformis]|uniref:Putative deoxyribonuclease RhsC n=1 Tax=Candidatus Phycosocius bacilliformis TaxID=1445552 RepID=A0A2P2E9Z8_9PROT|nr:RHS repeat-associated core domain-containing protein [Candidatus Phycosocius bacilliformis]GBF57881.1 putative deoxyribonuclease RhsC [Candidatus Phycosocius bacilliformis]
MPLATAVGQTGTLNWLHTHHHGAPILTTNAAGSVVPYPAHAVLGFPGQFANSQQLAGAQHYYNRYRDYDVNTGRYIQAHPIGLAGDDNPYAYARGNPLRYKDPSGEFAFLFVPAACVGGGCQAAVAATGALIGGAIAWTALHPMGKPDNVAPLPIPLQKTDCPVSKNGKCPPCRTVIGRIVPLGTIVLRPLDNPKRPQHGIVGAHYNLLIAHQAPINSPRPCKCFWRPAGAVAPGNLPVGAIPVEPFPN